MKMIRARSRTLNSLPRWWMATLSVLVSVGVANSGAILESSGQIEDSAFRVASVRASHPDGGRASTRVFPGGRFAARNRTLKLLISWAYEFDASRVLGGPDWIDEDRFDLLATFEAGADVEADTPRVRRVLQHLLAERFALRLRTEFQELQYYALVLTDPGGGRPSGIRPSTVDCAEYHERMRREGPPVVVPTGPFCGAMFTLKAGQMRMRLGGEPMTRLARGLQLNAGGPVEDETGLAGRFDVDLTYALDRTLFSAPDRYGATPADAPSVFRALEEQLGLELRPRRGPIEVLVVDSAKRPTPN